MDLIMTRAASNEAGKGRISWADFMYWTPFLGRAAQAGEGRAFTSSNSTRR